MQALKRLQSQNLFEVFANDSRMLELLTELGETMENMSNIYGALNEE